MEPGGLKEPQPPRGAVPDDRRDSPTPSLRPGTDSRYGDRREDRGPPWAGLEGQTTPVLVRLKEHLESQMGVIKNRAEAFRAGIAEIQGIRHGREVAERVAAGDAGWGVRRAFLLGVLRDGVDPGLIRDRAGVPGELVEVLAERAAAERAHWATPASEVHRARRAAAATRLLAWDPPVSGGRGPGDAGPDERTVLEIGREAGLDGRTVSVLDRALRTVGDFSDWPAADSQPPFKQQRPAALWLLESKHPSHPPEKVARLLGEDEYTIDLFDQERQGPGYQPVRWQGSPTPEGVRQLVVQLRRGGMQKNKIAAELGLAEPTVSRVLRDRLSDTGSPPAKPAERSGQGGSADG